MLFLAEYKTYDREPIVQLPQFGLSDSVNQRYKSNLDTNTIIKSIFFKKLYSKKLENVDDLKTQFNILNKLYNKNKSLTINNLLKNGYDESEIDFNYLEDIKYIYYFFNSFLCIVLGNKKEGFSLYVKKEHIEKEKIDKLKEKKLLTIKHKKNNIEIYKKASKLFRNIKNKKIRLSDIFEKRWHYTKLEDAHEVNSILKTISTKPYNLSNLNKYSKTKFALKQFTEVDTKDLKMIYKTKKGILGFLIGYPQDLTFASIKLKYADIYISKLEKAGLIEHINKSDEIDIYSTSGNWDSDYLLVFGEN